MYLQFKKCDVVITRAKVAADKDDWEEKGLKAINLIYSAVSNKQLEFVCEEDTVYKIIKKLDDIYLKESTALQIVYRNKLEKLRLEKYSDTATFFSELEKSVNELKSAGAKISEEEKQNYMLNTFPNKYSYIGDSIDTLKEEDQTASHVKNKIQIAEMKNNSEHSEQRSNICHLCQVFAAKKDQKGSCFKCGGTGHFARECQNGEQAGQSGTT